MTFCVWSVVTEKSPNLLWGQAGARYLTYFSWLVFFNWKRYYIFNQQLYVYRLLRSKSCWLAHVNLSFVLTFYIFFFNFTILLNQNLDQWPIPNTWYIIYMTNIKYGSCSWPLVSIFPLRFHSFNHYLHLSGNSQVYFLLGKSPLISKTYSIFMRYCVSTNFTSFIKCKIKNKLKEISISII